MVTRPGQAGRTPCEVARRPVAGERRAGAVVDCVGDWLEGEVREFRGGVKREIGEFRAGFDRLRRGVDRLRSRLRGAD